MIANPLWDRQIAISKVSLEVMMMELQMEMTQGASVYGVKNNGSKIRREEGRQSANPSQEVRDIPAGDNAEQRDQVPNGGTDY
jgi:hypothetical protein